MRTVTATGHGSATAVPDTAVIRLAIAHQAPTLVDALAGVESGREALVAALAATTTGTPRTVGSAGLSVWPATDDHGFPAGFSAEHTLTVRCPGLAEAGQLVGVAAGAVGDRLRIHGVSLVVADPSAAVAAARDDAWADAVDRATRLARLAGGSLGQVEAVLEGAPMPGPAGSLARDSFAAKSVSFEPGETGIEAAVTVTWQLV